MSRDDRDKRGGHSDRRKDVYPCGCCPVLSPDQRSTGRARRNAALDKHERRAEEDA